MSSVEEQVRGIIAEQLGLKADEIKNDASLAVIPVVVMTTSKADEDIVRSYKLHANCYVTKPVDLDQFMNVVRATQEFWLSIVKLPPHEQP